MGGRESQVEVPEGAEAPVERLEDHQRAEAPLTLEFWKKNFHMFFFF